MYSQKQTFDRFNEQFSLKYLIFNRKMCFLKILARYFYKHAHRNKLFSLIRHWTLNDMIRAEIIILTLLLNRKHNKIPSLIEKRAI